MEVLMELREFLSFKKDCFICQAPIKFAISDCTNQAQSIQMHVFQMLDMSVLKIHHKNLNIFVNMKKNLFMLEPNNSQVLRLAIEGYCSKDRSHYHFDCSDLTLDYHGSWTSFPNMDIQEIITFRPPFIKGDICSIINNYNDNTTSVFFAYKIGAEVIPLIFSEGTDKYEFEDKVKLYLALQ